MIAILFNIILPVLLVAAAGFALERAMIIDLRSVSRVTLYILSPALVFSSLVNSTLTETDFWHITSFTVLITLIMWLISWSVARLLRFDRGTENAFLLTTLFVNAGNYGLPLNLFAFGQPGLERAIVFFVTSALLSNTLAVYFASRGGASVGRSLLNIFRVPMIYAVILAAVVRTAGFTVPETLFKSIDMVGRAAVPVMLLLLGMQLSQTSLDDEWGVVALATFMRLGVAAVVAVGLAGLMGLQGVTRQASIVEASMPTAVMVTILATEFEAKSAFVTSVVFVTTLASVLTLTLLLRYLIG